VVSLKSTIKIFLGALPVIRRLYYRRIYRAGYDDKLIRGRIQQIGHALDLRMTGGSVIPTGLLQEFRFFWAKAMRRRLALDEAMLWGWRMYCTARHGLPGTPEAEAPAATDQSSAQGQEISLFDAIRQRRRVRKWNDRPVDVKDIEDAIELARWSPSSCNRQLWQVLPIQEKVDKDALDGFFPDRHKQAPMILAVLMNTRLYGQAERHFTYLDAGAFIQNLLLALHAKGYGCCWLGFTAWDVYGNLHVPAERKEKFYSHFGLDPSLVPVSFIALGRRIENPPAPPRQSLDNVILRRKGQTEGQLDGNS